MIYGWLKRNRIRFTLFLLLWHHKLNVLSTDLRICVKVLFNFIYRIKPVFVSNLLPDEIRSPNQFISNFARLTNSCTRADISPLLRFLIFSVPNFSTQKEASAEPKMMAFFMLLKLTVPTLAI